MSIPGESFSLTIEKYDVHVSAQVRKVVIVDNVFSKKVEKEISINKGSLLFSVVLTGWCVKSNKHYSLLFITKITAYNY